MSCARACGYRRSRYSLKKVEKLYMPKREGPVTTPGFSTVAYEKFLNTGDQNELNGIEDYNRDDCVSTFLLRRWLEERRLEAEEQFGVSLPRPVPRSSEAARPRAPEPRRPSGASSRSRVTFQQTPPNGPPTSSPAGSSHSYSTGTGARTSRSGGPTFP